MRRLFILLTKLFGLFQVYWTLVNLVQVGFAIEMCIRASSASETTGTASTVVYTMIYLGLSGGVAWVLMMRTEWLADKLGILGEGEWGEFKEDAVLRTGAKLIGLYILACALPALIRAMLGHGMLSGGRVTAEFWPKVIPPSVEIAIGAFLALRTDSVLAVVANAEHADGRRVFLIGCGFFLLVLVLSLIVSSWRSENYNDGWPANRGVIRTEGNLIPTGDTNNPYATDRNWNTSTGSLQIQDFLQKTNWQDVHVKIELHK